MNTLVNKVIQTCAGLEPGDFEQVFVEIRKEIKRQGKNLTLLIEDVTAFTGVNVALLNVLTTEHTGMYESQELCRISSIVGTTEKYFNVNFMDNHKDNIHGNIQVLDGIKKDAKTISVAFGEVEKGIASTDDIDTLLMFSKDPLTKLERVLSILQTVQKDIEYVARDVEKRRGNILVDNGGDLSTRYVELRNKIELDSKTIMDWKVM